MDERIIDLIKRRIVTLEEGKMTVPPVAPLTNDQWSALMSHARDTYSNDSISRSQREREAKKMTVDDLSFPDLVKLVIDNLGGIDKTADLMKVSQSTICRWKDGLARPMDSSTEKTMRELANGTEVDLDRIAKYAMKRSHGGRNGRLREDVVASVMRGMEAHPHADEGHKVAGINNRDYLYVRKLIILSKHRSVPVAEREEIAALLEKIDRERSCSAHEKEIKNVIDRRWPMIAAKPRLHTTERNKKRFDLTIINVGEVCSSMNDMTIPPDLSDTQRDASIATLMASAIHINELVKRLVGGGDHD